jgi:hypothetical protein
MIFNIFLYKLQVNIFFLNVSSKLKKLVEFKIKINYIFMLKIFFNYKCLTIKKYIKSLVFIYLGINLVLLILKKF